MPLPILVLPTSWETTKKVTLAEVSTNLGDGYTQDVLIGVDPESVEWQVRSPALSQSVAESIISQLETFQGVITFSWSPDNGLTLPFEPCYCLQWDLIPLGTNAFEISGVIYKDKLGQNIALAAQINTTAIPPMLEGAITFLNTYTRDDLPNVANAQGVTCVNFQTNVGGKESYIPPSAGTSDIQALLITALLKSREVLTNSVVRTTALNLATTYANALVTYFYELPIPANPTANLWVPNWLISAKSSFTSKGKIPLNGSIEASGYYDVNVSFTNGIGFLPTGSPNFGELVSDVYMVSSTNSTRLWQNVFSPLASGISYPINYWVSNDRLLGTNYQKTPNTNAIGGILPVQTNEPAGKILLATQFTGTLKVTYMAYVGASVAKNAHCDNYPMWRPIDFQLNQYKERIFSLLSASRLDKAFSLMFAATGNSQWDRAQQSNKHSTNLCSAINTASYLFRTTDVDINPFDLPGTSVKITNNSAGFAAYRTGATGLRYIEIIVNNGVELNPSAELVNTFTKLQIESSFRLEVEYGCTASTILEIYLSLATSTNDDTQRFVFYQPVLNPSSGLNSSVTILPEEFIKYTLDTVWHSWITPDDNSSTSTTTYTGGGSTITRLSQLSTISGFRRLTSTFNFNRIDNNILGVVFQCKNLINLPPKIYYAKTGSILKLKVTDSNNQDYYWTLPNTSNLDDYITFIPTWANSESPNVVPGIDPIISVEIVSLVNGSSSIRIWWMGASPEILPYPSISYKAGIVSKVSNSFHSFQVGNVRGINSAIESLKGSPGVVPFARKLLSLFNGNYQLNGQTGLFPLVGYQDPYIWLKWGETAKANQVLEFLDSSQVAYTRQNENNTIGPFMPAYVWPNSETGINAQINTWTFEGTTDPNYAWEGYQYRPLVATAEYWLNNPRDIKATNIVMRYLGFIDVFYRRNGNSIPPSTFKPIVDPTVEYTSVQASAMIAVAALYANIAGGNSSITFRVLKKSLDFILTQYSANGSMLGTFSNSMPTFIENGFNGRQYPLYHHAECMIALSEILRLKDQIVYPPVGSSLI